MIRNRLRNMVASLAVTRPHPWLVSFPAAFLGSCSGRAPIAGALAASSIGGLVALNAYLQARIVALVLAATLLIDPAGLERSTALWLTFALALFASLAPRRWASAMMSGPRWTWHLTTLTATCSICLILLYPTWIATALAMASCFYMGGTVTRSIAKIDARLLSWGDEGLVAVTRDLLLGRVTSGMLHDLAQPLNVISMANGNMGYIAENLAIEEEERKQLLDRVARISQHTQSAANILSLFRWFGRDGNDVSAQLTVRSALERAVAATRSNVRHHDVAVEIKGDGLEYFLPTRHGHLELIAVAILLCAFGSFIAPDGTKKKGKVFLQATTSPAHVIITLRCTDAEGRAVQGKAMDHATAWLVDQVAYEASGDLRPILRDGVRERFVIRLGRDDI